MTIKILYLTPVNPNIVTPETGYAQKLAARGHEITFGFGYTPKMLKLDYDIVYGAMEYSMNIATWISKKLKIPCYNHMEWIPPWRVGLDDPKNWGYDGTTFEKIDPFIVQKWYAIYIQQVQDWENATISSLSGKCFKPIMKQFATKPINTEIKYYAANFNKLKHYKSDNIKEKNQIMSTARLVPHKRIIHIVRALAKVKNAPPYKVIGYGNELGRIQKEAKELGVDIEIIGPGAHGIKERIIQESMFSINIWAGIPMAESYYYKKPAIGYAEEHVQEVLGKSPLWAERNNIDDLAKKIQYFLDNPKERKESGAKAYELMINDKIGMGTEDRLMKELERIMYKGIDRYEGPK